MKFDIMRCAVAIAGDQRQVVHIGETGDLTWPEVVILTAIHGAHSVTDIAVTGERDDIVAEVELERLKKKYPGIAGAVFSGYAAQIPAKAPDHIERFDDEIIERVVIRRPRGAAASAAQAVPKTAGEAATAPSPEKRDRTAAARAAKAAKAAAAAEAAGGADGSSPGADGAGGADGEQEDAS